MPQLKAVLFEAPDSLVETELWGHRAAFNNAFREAHLDWYWDAALYDALRWMADDKARIQFYLENFHLQCGVQQDVTHMIKRLCASKQQHYQQFLQSGNIPLRSGLKRLLIELNAAAVRLAMVRRVEAELLTDSLQVLLHEEMHCPVHFFAAPQHSEPSAGFLTALRKLDLPATACLAIVSSSEGHQAAQTAGLSTVVISSFYTEPQDFSGARAVINAFGQPDEPSQLFAGKMSSFYVTAQALQELHDSPL